MSMRSAKVPLSPSSALQTMYFWPAGASQHGLPLDAGGEACAAAAAQAGGGDLGHHLLRRHGTGGVQADQAAMGAVVVEREGIDHADAGEGEAVLAAQPRQVGGGAEAARVGGGAREAGVREAGVEQGGDVGGAQRTMGDAA